MPHPGRPPGVLARRGTIMNRRPTGRAIPAAERMRRWRARQRAQGLKSRVVWDGRPGRAPPRPSMERRLHEARTLVLCVVAAAKIDRDPALFDLVHRNFGRWQERDRCMPGVSVRLWRKLLRLPWPDIAARLTEQSPQGLRLRAVAPLLGVLAARERRRIAAAFAPGLIP